MTNVICKGSKKAVALLIALIMCFSVFCSMGSFDTIAASGGFYVSGTTIYDANGNPFVMRGVNIPHAWYPGETETAIRGAAALGANTVRLVLSNGSVYAKTSRQELENIINWCKSNRVVAVLEIHDSTGSDDMSALDRAVDYWIEMRDLLVANQQYVIVNIANEWYGTWDAASWANGYKSAIPRLRSAGITNMLMVDCAGWGQYPDSIRYYGGEVFNADPQRNTVFSIHMYEYAGGAAGTSRANIDNALSIGVPLVIGEFGHYHTNGDVDEYAIMSYCRERGVGYIAWSWRGNNGDYSYLDIANSWDGSSLTDWGNTLFNDANGIRNTSSICSVYTASAPAVVPSIGSGASTGGLDGEYYIRNLNSGKYLDVAGISADNGANILQWSFTGADNQKFRLVSDGNGYYSILTGVTGYTKSIDVDAWGTHNGANILQWEYHGGDCQKFEIVQNGGAYVIRTKVTNKGKCLDVEGPSVNDGANVHQWDYYGGTSQQWVLEPVNGAGNGSGSLDGTYYLRNANSGKYLDVAGISAASGANIQQWGFTGADNQKFRLVSDGNGYYSILTGVTGYTKAIDVDGWGTHDGANIIQWDYHGGDCQKFQIVQAGNGYIIKTKITGNTKALDVDNASTNDGANVHQWDAHSNAWQIWILERA